MAKLLTPLLKADNEGFERSPLNKGALVNTDNSALNNYKSMKRRFSKLNQVDSLEERISTLEHTISGLVDLIKNHVITKDSK